MTNKMTYAVFDTETTGLWNFKKPMMAPCQPYPIETSVMLYDQDDQLLEDITVYTIPPDGVSISKGASDIHGISNERIHRIGKSMEEGMLEVQAVMSRADYLVGFNVDFDTKILAGAAARTYGRYMSGVPMFDVPRQQFYCVMKKLTSVMKIKHPSRRGFKWPRLEEAVEKILNKKHIGAHAAREDVLVTAELFQKMMQTTDLETLV